MDGAMRVATAALLTLAFFPAVAAADAGYYSADGWHYAGERVAHNADLDAYAGFAKGFWQARGVRPCRATILLAPDLGPGVDARSDPVSCRVWFRTEVVENAQGRNRDVRLIGQLAECTDGLHEFGHLGGLAQAVWDGVRWVDHHAASGIMAADGGGTGSVWWVSRGRVRGAGACGGFVARRLNAARRARLARAHLHRVRRYAKIEA